MSTGARLAFRLDAGPAVGLGHLRRCLALAHAARDLGAAGGLFVMDADRRAQDLVEAAGFDASTVAGRLDPDATIARCRVLGADALVVDSYAISTDHLAALAGAAPLVAAFDDTAERDLPVDLVINGSAGAGGLPYRGAPRTRWLLGPRYLALQPEFAETTGRAIRERVQRVLVTVGGADPFGLTGRLVTWVSEALGAGVGLDVVAGPLVDEVDALRSMAHDARGSVRLHESPKSMRDLMLSADLAVSGGGQTVYELAATGTPTVAVRLAENQAPNLRALEEARVLAFAGDAADPALRSSLVAALAALAADLTRRTEMSQRGRGLVDGRGAARLARVILDLVEARR